MQQLILDIRKTTLEVTGKLTDILFVQYPKLRDAFHSVIEKVLTDTADDVVNKLNGILDREKDPFTLNDFLQQWVNKIRFDKFSTAVDTCFDNAKTPAKNWNGLKDEIFVGLKQWYRTTHAISPLASAQDMCAIMEAYWNLSAKRFIDNCCMIADRDILSKLPSDVQDNLYPFIRDDAILEVPINFIYLFF
jgi:interferon-induced GTP-binding protein Mx1